MADRTLTVSEALRAAARTLEAADVDSPRLAAEALLADLLHLDRARLLARLPQLLSPRQYARFQTLVDRCASGEPLAYILGRREFYALDFRVDARVLIPRPETELLIDTALAFIRARGDHNGSAGADIVIADIGTGSGAIAVTLAVHLPRARLIATDLSADALAVALDNARAHGVADRFTFKVGDLLDPLDTPVDLLAANLPYVRSREWAYLAQSIRKHEPALAFNGGADGLNLISRLLGGAPRALKPGGAVLLEIGASQGDAARELALDTFPDADIRVIPDYAGLDRLLLIRTSPAA